MGVMVFAALILQSGVGTALCRGRVRVQAEPFIQEWLDVLCRLRWCLVPEGAGLEFGED